jgi:hypothetical protein
MNLKYFVRSVNKFKEKPIVITLKDGVVSIEGNQFKKNESTSEYLNDLSSMFEFLSRNESQNMVDFNLQIYI